MIPAGAPLRAPGPAADAAVPGPSLLADLVDLTKARITSFVTLSVATGYLAFARRFDVGLVLPAVGVFLLACGSAALNQVQEARTDARMVRTRNRPIPAGRMSRETALFVALLLMGAGLTMLASVERHAVEVLGLGALAVAWYNAVYLWLKRSTAFAVVPGALVGAIPPAIGWAAAGGEPLDPAILDVAGLFFVWQIPHFWLLTLRFGPDYAQAGLPSLTERVSPRQLGRITFAWVVALVATGIVVAVRVPLGLPWNLLALVAGLWLLFSSVPVLRLATDRATVRAAFLRINVYAFAMMVCISANALA